MALTIIKDCIIDSVGGNNENGNSWRRHVDKNKHYSNKVISIVKL